MKKNTSEKKDLAVERRSSDSSQSKLAPKKLKLLITVVNRQKSEFFTDLIQSFEANIQLTMAAKGTAKTEMLEYLGLSADSEKSVIISVIREDMEKQILAALKDRFTKIKNGKGIAYTIPMTSTIGVATYQFLSNTAK